MHFPHAATQAAAQIATQAAAAPRTGRPRRRVPWILAAVAIAVLVVAAPRPLPAHAATGQTALSDRIAGGPGAPAGDFAAAVIDDDGVRFAGRGADAHTGFEVGSISKVFGGMLLADAIERGEVSAGTTLGQIFGYPQDGSGAITLVQLATHTSGLPRLPTSPGFLATTLFSQVANTNPYVQSTPATIDLGRRAHPDPDRGFSYSNFGAALLGQALARVVGTSYPELVAERITGPLGMDQTWVQSLDPDTAAASRGTAPRRPTTPATGHRPSGHVAAPWPMDGFAPAGGIHSTAGDLALLARAVLDGTAPGMASLRPLADTGDGSRVGMAWMSTPGEHPVVWHNGMTAGFAAYLGLSRDAGRAVVVLSNTAQPVDEAGVHLLEAGRP
ncbi:serine hydrolase domain-containing protein [Arthrobacter sp. JSM 101049]|uniref:serine hydrolase domain-containing protein n=1 Tax=Arthrobacter sp. JSM 101049 TaxID=929097 RepID=UPI00356A0257